MTISASNRCVRWLHLSDFHVGKDNYATRQIFSYIIDHVREQKKQGLVPDFLFLTGDLANHAKSEEYETFWMEFIDPLQTLIGGGIQARTYAVPGNHDVERGKHGAFSREDMTDAKSRYFDPTDEGKELREMLLPRFQKYMGLDMTPVGKALFTNRGAFAEAQNVRGIELGIVGINTAWLSKGDDDRGKLTIAKPLLEEALKAVASCSFRIVLGHHPLDWMKAAELKQVKSLLGKHHVLYLHGHMHEAWGEPSYSSAGDFLTIQAGAAFQAREGEKWRNGLVWGELHPDQREVRLQPWNWSPDEQTWKPDGAAFPESHRRNDWWHYDYPTKRNQTTSASGAEQSFKGAAAPKGWSVWDPVIFTTYEAPLDETSALRFFDGAVPDWQVALSVSVPRRSIVSELMGSFAAVANRTTQSIVTLLLAAGCEGKTTAVLQAAGELVKGGGWRVLQRRDEALGFNAKEMLAVLDPVFKWLIVVDEADNVAPALAALLTDLPPELHGRVHCLLACRDADWRSSPASQIVWPGRVSFSQENLAGMDDNDVQNIVDAWGKFGSEGLGDLSSVPPSQRVQCLSDEAHMQAQGGVGTFFGALLMVRSSQHLHQHAVAMLERLRGRSISGGGTLYTALAMVAIMHKEGLDLLSRPVLAQALGCPIEKLHKEVLAPLGKEAAATTTSSFIYTRHAEIAKALYAVLESEFGEDLGALYVLLARSAIIAATRKNANVPQFKQWRFDFMRHFYDCGAVELGLQIGLAVLAEEPDNSNVRNHVAKLHREAQHADRASEIFNQAPEVVRGNRGFYYEWGIAEAACGNLANNVLLAAFSLSDQCSDAYVENNQAMTSLHGMGEAFGLLFTAYNDPVFRDARMSVAVLGLTLRLDRIGKENFNGHKVSSLGQGARVPPTPQALEIIKAGIQSAVAVAQTGTVPTSLPHFADLTFLGLERLVMNSQRLRAA